MTGPFVEFGRWDEARRETLYRLMALENQLAGAGKARESLEDRLQALEDRVIDLEIRCDCSRS